MIILFRVDTGTIIGTGHLLRCLNLAEKFISSYDNCQIIWATVEHDNNLISRITSNPLTSPHYHIIKLRPQEGHQMTDNTATWLGNIDQDISQIMVGLHDMSITYLDLLVIDHYAIDYRWESWFLGQFPDTYKILVVDDLANRDHICDYLVDTTYIQNSYESNNNIQTENQYNNIYHQKQLVSKATKVMTGSKYVMMSSQFGYYRNLVEEELSSQDQQVDQPISDKFRISIAFGGSDISNVTGKVLGSLINYYHNDIEVDIILGGLNRNKEVILAQIPQELSSTYRVYQNIGYDEVLKLLSKTHLGIGAGGVTLYERCCLGVPSVVITLAENQKGNAIRMFMDDLITYLGGMNDWTDRDLCRAIDSYKSRYRLNTEWHTIRKKCMSIVDDQGCQRIVDNMDLDLIE